MVAKRAKKSTQVPSTSEVRDAITSLRRRVVDSKRQIQRIEELPVASEEAKARLDQTLSRIVREINLTKLTLPEPRGGPVEIDNDAIAGVLLAANMDAVRAHFSRSLDAKYQTITESISSERRMARLAELEADLLGTEMAEEAIIRRCERDGLRVERRGDLDPRAALAPDDELPQ